ncbi:MAG: fumarylacetoacetate hydrolase family protein [Planctomycetia bacterium]
MGDPQKLGLTLDVNGVRRQNGDTATLIFDVWHLVHYLCQFVTLAIDGLGSQRSVCEQA